jgi:hypothetical protein
MSKAEHPNPGKGLKPLLGTLSERGMIMEGINTVLRRRSYPTVDSLTAKSAKKG